MDCQADQPANQLAFQPIGRSWPDTRDLTISLRRCCFGSRQARAWKGQVVNQGRPSGSSSAAAPAASQFLGRAPAKRLDMVYVSAAELCRTPLKPWNKWTCEARLIAGRCAKDDAKWLKAEARNPEMALWAASCLKCTDRTKGRRVCESPALRRMWLDELQGKPQLYVN